MQIAPDQIDPDAAKVVLRLRDNGHLAYLVGGCVRDLLLGRKPKDFDVVTSATPNEIKRLFKNSRIIGRRFRLAHVFYGPKIIETSTFRANPRELEEEEGDGGDAESGDLLIRRDNVFGTPEEDARRRDFTINGLFYDIKTGQVIDHVNGMADLEARVVRTIGDPDIRFREDPIRILRAVKFAARCDLSIEPETYRRMMEHRDEIAKCAQARVSEEFYRLLRAGAARRSMELLVETDLLQMLTPETARGWRPAPPARDRDADAVLGTGEMAAVGEGAEGATGESEAEAARLRARLWAYLAALDRSTERRPIPPPNALILAVLLLPPLRDALDPASNGVRDLGHLVTRSIAPALERLRPSRRDSEIARQLLLALRGRLRRLRRNGPERDLDDELTRFSEIVVDAETLDPSLAGRPIVAEGTDPASAESTADESDASPELDGMESGAGGRRRRRGRRGRGRQDEAPRTERGAAGPPRSVPRPVGELVPAVAVDLNGLLAATRSLLALPARPAFLGGGGFGGPWSSRVD